MLAFGHLKYSPPAEIQPSFTTAEQFAAGTAQLEAPVTERACPAPEVLLAFSEGMLDSRAAADIDSHLRVCQDCCDLRNRLDSFERTISSPLETDRYQILHEIGRGGMGIVYCAHDRRKNRTVALKVIRPEIAADANSLRRLRNEVLLACTIRHPNVCRSYEFHRTSNSAFITMEYVDGVTLRKRLEQGPKPDFPEVLSIAAQICDGLSELHKHQIIHRDLKPDNIMIERNGDVKLTDFGLALYLDPEATASVAAGTPAYMAPEQMAGLCVDQRADIYSLGLVLCDLFSGRSPGFARVETSTHQAMSRWFTDACPHLPNVVREKLVQSLHRDVALRPQTVAEITRTLPSAAQFQRLRSCFGWKWRKKLETPKCTKSQPRGPEGPIFEDYIREVNMRLCKMHPAGRPSSRSAEAWWPTNSCSPVLHKGAERRTPMRIANALLFVALLLILLIGLGGCGSTPGTSRPVAAAITFSPSDAVAGSPDVTLTITGSGFAGETHNRSQAVWFVNGTNTFLQTTFVSSTQLTAMIPAALLGSPVTAQVSVETGDLMGDIPLNKSVTAMFTVSAPH